MTLTPVALTLLSFATLFFAIAAVSEREALTQMCHSDYKWVPLIRMGRRMRIPALGLVLAYVFVAMAASPLTGILTFLLAFLLTMFSQSQAIVYGQAMQVFLRGLAPALLCLTTLANLELLVLQGAFKGLQLPPGAVGLVALASALSWLTAALRSEQDLVALRD